MNGQKAANGLLATVGHETGGLAVAWGAPILCVLGSLSLGGAQRIVAEWLGEEAKSGRTVELAAPFSKDLEIPLPKGVRPVRRHASLSVRRFLLGVGADWARTWPGVPVHVHLFNDEMLQALWDSGCRTVCVFHNDKDGWNSGPEAWRPADVPLAIGCAPFVARQGELANPGLFWSHIRHRPSVPARATDKAAGLAVRRRWKIGQNERLAVMSGSFKEQKDYKAALDVLEATRGLGNWRLAIMGGVGTSDMQSFREFVAEVKGRDLARLIRLPGFVREPGPWLAAADAFLNTSRFEGFSMAVMEAQGAGIPCLCPELPGFEGMSGEGLVMLSREAPATDWARALNDLPARWTDGPRPPLPKRVPRVWGVANGLVERLADDPLPDLDGGVLFATGNLGAGGAQRSLVNLLCKANGRDGFPNFALAVGSVSNHESFIGEAKAAGFSFFGLSSTTSYAAAERLIASVARTRAKTLVFWNFDVKSKLLVGKFLPPDVRIVDVSPGDYAFARLEAVEEFARLIDFGFEDFSKRVSVVVQKFNATNPSWLTAKTVRIPNGVPMPPETKRKWPDEARFVVCGRIAPSKRLETVFGGFAAFLKNGGVGRMSVIGQAEEGDGAYLDGLVERFGGIVDFLGPDPDLSFYSQDITALVVFGTNQGSPNTVLESLARGVPVIANDSGGTSEALLADPENPGGILLPEEASEDELSRAMARLASSRDTCAAMGAAGRVAMKRWFSMEGMVGAYAGVLGEASKEVDGEPLDNGF